MPIMGQSLGVLGWSKRVALAAAKREKREDRALIDKQLQALYRAQDLRGKAPAAEREVTRLRQHQAALTGQLAALKADAISTGIRRGPAIRALEDELADLPAMISAAEDRATRLQADLEQAEADLVEANRRAVIEQEVTAEVHREIAERTAQRMAEAEAASPATKATTKPRTRT